MPPKHIFMKHIVGTRSKTVHAIEKRIPGSLTLWNMLQGKNLPRTSCCTSLELSEHTRGRAVRHVPETRFQDMYALFP